MPGPRIAFFPDSFREVNGVAHTARQFEAWARHRRALGDRGARGRGRPPGRRSAQGRNLPGCCAARPCRAPTQTWTFPFSVTHGHVWERGAGSPGLRGAGRGDAGRRSRTYRAGRGDGPGGAGGAICRRRGGLASADGRFRRCAKLPDRRLSGIAGMRCFGRWWRRIVSLLRASQLRGCRLRSSLFRAWLLRGCRLRIGWGRDSTRPATRSADARQTRGGPAWKRCLEL